MNHFTVQLMILFPLMMVAASTGNSGSYFRMETESLLPACPDTPNCVSSLAKDPAKRVDPFPVKTDPASSMDLLKDIVTSMPRTTIISKSETRIESEFRSILGFVDDVLFVVSSDGRVIHVRSASRKGSWDLGVNRRRVEKIRVMYLRDSE